MTNRLHHSHRMLRVVPRPYLVLSLLLLLLSADSLSAQPERPFYLPQSYGEEPLETEERGEDSEKPGFGTIAPHDYVKALAHLATMPAELDADPERKGADIFESRGGIWRPIGPRATPMRGRPGLNMQGRIRSMRWHGNELYLGSSSGGLYTISPHGATVSSPARATLISASMPNPSVGAFLVNPWNPRMIFIGTGDWARDGQSPRYSGSGLYVTTDGGATWRRIPLYGLGGFIEVVPGSITDIVYDVVSTPSGPVTDTNTLYLSSSSGLFRSTDAGVTWRQLSLMPGNSNWGVFDLVRHPRQPGTLYAALPFGGGVMKTSDGGNTWFAMNNGLPSSNLGRTLAIAISESDPEILYLAVPDANDNIRGIYRTSNGGAQWENVNGDLRDYMRNRQGHHANFIEVHPYNSSVVYAGSVNLIRTTDRGVTWTVLDGGHDDYLDVLFDPVDLDKVYIANDGGLYLHNATTGTIANDMYEFPTNSPLQSYGFDVAWSDPWFMVGGTQDNGTLRTVGHLVSEPVFTWEMFSGCDGADKISIHTIASQIFYFNQWCGGSGLRKRSRNGGATEENVDRSLAGIWMTPIAVAPGNPDVVFTVDTDRLWYSTNEAESWFMASAGPDGARDFPTGRIPSRMSVSYGPEPRVYVTFGTADMMIASGSLGSMTWRTVRAGTRPISDVIPDRWDERVAYALGSYEAGTGIPNRIFRTTDDGATWTDITGNLPNIGYWDVEREIGNMDVLYVATSIGIFKTRDGGRTWNPFQNGLPIVGVGTLAYIPSLSGNRAQDTLRASTYGFGYWERVLDREDPIWTPSRRRIEDGTSPRLTSVVEGRAQGGTRGSQTMIALTDTTLIARSANGGRSWDYIDAGVGFTAASVAASDCTTFITVGAGGAMWRTEDAGVTWNPLQAPVAVDLFDVAFRDPYNGWAVGDAGTILATQDGGESWNVVNEGKGNERLISIAFISDLVGFATGYDDTDKPPRPVTLRTDDGGLQWYPDPTLDTQPILKVRNVDGKLGFAIGEEGYLAKTTDGGGSWAPVATFTDAALTDCLFTTADSGWACTALGEIYLTTDGGETWNAEELAEQPSSLARFALGGNTLVAIGDTSILVRLREYLIPPVSDRDAAPQEPWDTTKTDTVITDTTSSVGAHDQLARAGYLFGSLAPNPFTASTSLAFRVPHPAWIEIAIYDVNGNPVRVLESGDHAIGNYRATWDGANDRGIEAPPGLYLCRISTPAGVAIRTILKIR